MVRLTTRSKRYVKKQLRTHLPGALKVRIQASPSVMLRHPIPVADEKWTQIPVAVLLNHTLVCYERFDRDMSFIRRLYVLRYEEFVLAPAFGSRRGRWLGNILGALGQDRDALLRLLRVVWYETRFQWQRDSWNALLR